MTKHHEMRVRVRNACGLATSDDGRSTDDITGVRPSLLARRRHEGAELCVGRGLPSQVIFGFTPGRRRDEDGLRNGPETDRTPSTRPAPRVLLADGDASARRELADALRGLGMDVEEVPDGGRLLVSVAAHYKNGHTPEDVDVIISDVRLAVCSGLQVFRGVRAAHWMTPVLLMTTYPTSEVRQTVAKLGAKLLVKPFELHDFERAVLELIARNRPDFRPSARER